MNKKLFSSALPFAIILAFFTQISVTNAADIDKTVKTFKKLIEENMAGQPFRKHDYLARSGIADKNKRYVGAVSDVKIQVEVDSNNKIRRCVIDADKDLRFHIMPIMEKHFGEYYKDLGTSNIYFLARLKGVKLSSVDYNSLWYEKNGLSATIQGNSVIKTTSGSIFEKATIHYVSYVKSKGK